jgi:hypothetical protein
MAIEIITPEDLERFGEKLTENIKAIIQDNNQPIKQEETTWIKSHHVQRMLGISPGTLQTLRINGTIPYTKVGGVIFYDKGEITKVLESNKRNSL